MHSEIITSENEPVSFEGRGAERAEREDYGQTRMRVTKRSGAREGVDVTKIVRAVSRSTAGLSHVDPLRVATKTISGLYDGATTRELDQLSIQTAAALIAEEPEYARLAARLLSTYIDKEVRGQEVHAFSQSVALAGRLGLANARLAGRAISSSSTSDCVRSTTATSCDTPRHGS
jgi:ribonucleoside-diphosphate reductase alpha chain